MDRTIWCNNVSYRLNLLLLKGRGAFIIYRKGGTLFLKKTLFDFSLIYPRKSGLRRKSKVCPWDTQIK